MALSNRPFRTFTLAWRDQASTSPSIESTFIPFNKASGNSCKILIGIQRSDHKLWLFRTITLVWRGQTIASPISNSRSTPRKMASKNSCKSLIEIPTIESKVMALSNRYSSLERLDLNLTEIRFHIHFMENGVRKIL
jgi:hypothetical protein